MTALTQQIFNLLLNSTFSFFAGCVIIFLSLWLFRIDNTKWKLTLLSLPFVKILLDLVIRRIPTSSIINAGINPLDLPPKHQTLTIGAGFNEWGPVFNFVFSSNTVDGKRYSSSIPDYVYAWLVKHFGPHAPSFVLIAFISVSACLVIQRYWGAYCFEWKRKRNREMDTGLETIPLKLRTIDVYSSASYNGSPFTGGILKPYICFPTLTLDALDKDERKAVLDHEIAHISNLDLPVTLLIRTLGDLLWFIPGYRFLSKRIDRLREIIADRTAVKRGASAAHLASALIKLKEIPDDTQNVILYSAFFKERSLLKTRVENLLERNQAMVSSRFGWKYPVIKVVVLVWTVGAVTVATFGGNHDVSVHEIPQWAERLWKYLGLM